MLPNLGRIVPNMRSKSSGAEVEFGDSGLASVLFTPVRQRVLALLFGQPHRRYQSGELIRLANSGTGAVHRLLVRLEATGLVAVEKIGNQKHYQANADSPVFEELTGLVRKTVGLVGPLRVALAPLQDRILYAFAYGSIAKGEEHAESDVDLMVIADNLDHFELFAVLPGLEAALARVVSPNLMTCSEWLRKREELGSFAARIASQPKLFVIGDEDGLAKSR